MAKETISQTEGLCKEVASCVRNAYDRGYKQGFKDGNYDKEFFCNLNFEHGTNKGLDDAWECARKICNMDYETRREALSVDDNHDLLGKIFNTFSASEAIAKIKEYEEKQKQDEKSCDECSWKYTADDDYDEWRKHCLKCINRCCFEPMRTDNKIKVGDEILMHNIQDAETYKAVVMDIDMDKGLWIFDENACNTVIEPNRYIGEEADIEVRKTGRTFPQIAEVLEQLKGE